jgi:hypothetical protein
MNGYLKLLKNAATENEVFEGNRHKFFSEILRKSSEHSIGIPALRSIKATF